ncbi:nucleoside hydrolase [Paenibacillus melissococcoides]|uniref:Nucleoside hydrolase n=1 Tax=Paenibacillus melissococcoides TaxID=2912268 RepID=A0ABM9GA41_9BACL|nr:MULTISPECIES: nucleoside hydrolase [Paenibacillus]MEB9892438.1 nucleoside hydrolase [Bacillus cereus]CAH8248237.1 nucleoside hydrolase [Paenibacillus melissococcoides]CAH8718083.1 nucleoside hydrolase [Paenibacillus melissococcoides]CAH8719039.1 nucleoside hydrolase [Paenibacillus melissococcoides]GIO78681.1 nucleoside hydrolase [Paenibacillus dendritiformis]
MSEKKRVILDTDTAGDDTIAILTALHYFQVEGIMITGGNVQFDQQVENALYTVQVAGKSGQVPVYKGHEGPIMGIGQKEHRTVEDVHGKDGMGDSFFEKAVQSPEKGHAIDFLIEAVHNNPGEIHLLAIAPLTNIAMAIKKDPTIVPKIPHLYIMGGTNNALGNITPSVEYNFYVDPEAAKIVLHSGIPITMVGWEMCTQYSIMDDNDHEEIEALGTKGAKFFKDVNKVVMRFNKTVHRLNGTTHPDTLLAAVAADEKIMTKSNLYHVDVETVGELTRGYSLVDINNRLERTRNVRVCEAIDRDAFKDMLLDVLKSIN